MEKNFQFLALLCACSLMFGCQDPGPIRIGFVGELTTRAAGLGTSGRDGFQLAIEEINAEGGINGRLVEGKTQDVRMHKATALNAVRILTDEKVSAIIGPMTSQTAVSILPEINKARIPTISPTVSTNKLSGLDDYFFRVYYTNAQAAQLLAKRMTKNTGKQHVVAIYDLGNKAYTEDWVNYFQNTLEESGNASVSRIPFDMRSETLFLELATKAIEKKPDDILILANAIDTAMICQQLQKLQFTVERYATGWSYSDDLIQLGGKSVEGLVIVQSADMKDSSPAMNSFVEKYRFRFRTEPNFPALHAYDATRMVLAALKNTTQPEKIKEYLLNMDSFRGAQTVLEFDRFGDLKSPEVKLAKVIDGKFIVFD